MPEKLNSVLALAAKGLRIFPLSKKRLPLWKRFYAKASSNSKVLQNHWTKHPKDNIAVATGLIPELNEHLIVVDIDKRDHKSGFEYLSLLEMLFDKFPETFTVQTRREGLHLYYLSPHPIANSSSKLANGIDIRGHHGYVAAPGTIDEEGRTYTVVKDLPIQPIPQWLIEQLGIFSERELKHQPVSSLDDPQAIQRATDYLINHAPVAQEGANGDLTTFKVAAQLKDYGVSQPTSFALLRDHWNEDKAHPPWDLYDLEQKTQHAYRYATNPTGILNPEADFEEFDTSQPFSDGTIIPNFDIPPIKPFDPLSLPKRQWLLGNIFLRGKISLLVAPPGSGKSTLTIGLALSVAANKPILGIQPVKQEKVILWNNEDDMDELKRRLYAQMQHYQVTFEDLLDKNHQPTLYIQSGENKLFTIARKQENTIHAQDASALKKFMIANSISLFIADPLAETHNCNENDNGEMVQVMQHYRAIAQQTNASICLVHHTRKPSTAAADSFHGDMNSGRGATAITGAVRIAITLYNMSKTDAKTYQIPEDQKHLYVRLDDAKANMSLKSQTPTWFKRVSVPITAYDPTDPATLTTEHVGVLEPVTLATTQEHESDLSDDLVADTIKILDGKKRVSMRFILDNLAKLEEYEDLPRNDLRYRLINALASNSQFEIEDSDATGTRNRKRVTFHGNPLY